MHLILLVVFGLSAASAAAAAARANRPVPVTTPAARCWQPRGTTEHIQSYIRALAVATEPNAVYARDQFSLPAIAPDSVQVVTEDLICGRVARAMETQVHGGSDFRPARVLVIRVGGTRFAAHDGTLRNGSGFWCVLDADLRLKTCPTM